MVEIFFLIRLFPAIVSPVSVFTGVALARAQLLPEGLADRFLTTSPLRLLQIAAIGAGIGFYGPGYWLKNRIKARQNKIREAFPNALDLVQISVEAKSFALVIVRSLQFGTSLTTALKTYASKMRELNAQEKTKKPPA